MARPNKKNVYERINDQKDRIKETEELLVKLNEELQVLYAEKDDLEMRQTWAAIKEKGFGIEEIQKLLAKQKNS